MLRDLMAYRDGVMDEALAQRDGIIHYFQGLCGFTSASHRKTTELCVIAMTIGEFLVMHFKRRYDRPRPSQLLPELLPPFPVPGHAAFPSGHAIESHLVALVLESVLPGRHPAQPLLRPMAERIAINREVMGLHYRTDSVAGKLLAHAAFRLAISTLTAKSPSAAEGDAITDPELGDVEVDASVFACLDEGWAGAFVTAQRIEADAPFKDGWKGNREGWGKPSDGGNPVIARTWAEAWREWPL